jgi:hypothetical protein
MQVDPDMRIFVLLSRSDWVESEYIDSKMRINIKEIEAGV